MKYSDSYNIWETNDDQYLNVTIDIAKMINAGRYYPLINKVDIKMVILSSSVEVCNSLGINNCKRCSEKCVLYNDVIESFPYTYMIDQSYTEMLAKLNNCMDESFNYLSNDYGDDFSRRYLEELHKSIIIEINKTTTFTIE